MILVAGPWSFGSIDLITKVSASERERMRGEEERGGRGGRERESKESDLSQLDNIQQHK